MVALVKKVLAVGLLWSGICASSAWAQGTFSVPAEVTIDIGELSILSTTSNFDFGDRMPGDTGVQAFQAPTIRIRDTRNSNSGYHITMQATTPFNSAGPSFASTNMKLTGFTALFQEVTTTGNPAPAAVSATGEFATTAVTVVSADQGSVGLTGKGDWDITPNNANFTLDIPPGTSAGSYTATVTFTILNGL